MQHETLRIPRPDYNALPPEAFGYVVHEVDDTLGRAAIVTFDGLGGALHERTATHSRWYCVVPNAGHQIEVTVTRE